MLKGHWNPPFIPLPSVIYFFWPGHAACEILVYDKGLNLHPLQWKHGFNHWDHRGHPLKELLIAKVRTI